MGLLEDGLTEQERPWGHLPNGRKGSGFYTDIERELGLCLVVALLLSGPDG